MDAALSTRFCAITIGIEGKFGADPYDRGNWTGGAMGVGELKGTKFGISAAAYPDLDIENLTFDDAVGIYQRDYLAKIRGADLPPPLALLVFDFAVNSGVREAIDKLQLVVGADRDGVIGDQTIAAVKYHATNKGLAAVCAEYLAQRLLFLVASPEWPRDGVGFARRVCTLAYQSLAFIPST